MERVRLSGRLPRCSRCRADLIVSAVAPEDDEQGRPIHLELCAVCDTGDADRPAAGFLVQWFTDGGGKDASRAQEGAHLLMECRSTISATDPNCQPIQDHH
ncbi:DUF6300 family protein [Streptomyces sp. NPDC053253]|uniref:DUF6300 family protein n=1 Tax=Streptomyces sp. NPDC053253 TaxID=3365699 RepID=UPI0037D3368A